MRRDEERARGGHFTSSRPVRELEKCYLRSCASHLAEESGALLCCSWGRRFLGGRCHLSALLLVAHRSGRRSWGGRTRRCAGCASWGRTAATRARHGWMVLVSSVEVLNRNGPSARGFGKLEMKLVQMRGKRRLKSEAKYRLK
jgi:hypothetical protein